jgi:hypothetical protein
MAQKARLEVRGGLAVGSALEALDAPGGRAGSNRRRRRPPQWRFQATPLLPLCLQIPPWDGSKWLAMWPLELRNDMR